MKIAAIGDIHSNHFVLEACLEEVRRRSINTVLFLGDYITDCPYPGKTIEILKSASERFNAVFVRGNREDYILEHHKSPMGWEYCSRHGSLLYTYENLTEEDLAWFERMPVSLQVDIADAEPVEICHGAMGDNRTHILPGTESERAAFRSMKTNLLLCAHTHERFILHEENSGKMIVNGGALGSGSKADFTVLEYSDGKWTPELVSVPYDVEGAVCEFYESGLAEKSNVWAKAVICALKSDRNYPIECIRTVSKLKSEDGESHEDEYYWNRAAKILGIE